MNTIYENLCSTIMDLEVICETLDSLRKGMDFATPRLPSDYLRILLASERIKEAIEILGRMIKKKESVTSTTQDGI